MNPTSTPNAMTASPLLQLSSILMEQKPSLAMQFLWWCAGANGQLLARCPTDYTKYGNIGATVLLTALLAFISMSYALNSVFDSLPAALGMGVVWAVVIFVLDRSIVSSMRKPPLGSGTFSKASFAEFPFLLVRLAVAVIISFTISKPLEVKLFENRIVAQIAEEKLDRQKVGRASADSASGVNQANDRVNQGNENLKDINLLIGQEPKDIGYQSLKTSYAEQLSDYRKTNAKNSPVIQKKQYRISTIKAREEASKLGGDLIPYNGNGAIERLAGEIGKLKREIRGKESLASGSYRKLQALIKAHKLKLGQEQSDAEGRRGAAIVIQARADSLAEAEAEQLRIALEKAFGRQPNGVFPLMTQMSALGKLAGKDDALRAASLLITLLFLVIELAPILVKLFSKRGAYDDELELAEHISWVRSQYEKSQINSRINRKLEAINQTDERVKRTVEARQNKTFETATKNIEQQQQIELANNERLLKLIAKRQIELAELMVEQWHQAELGKLKNTPLAAATPGPGASTVLTPVVATPASTNIVNQAP